MHHNANWKCTNIKCPNYGEHGQVYQSKDNKNPKADGCDEVGYNFVDCSSSKGECHSCKSRSFRSSNKWKNFRGIGPTVLARQSILQENAHLLDVPGSEPGAAVHKCVQVEDCGNNSAILLCLSRVHCLASGYLMGKDSTYN